MINLFEQARALLEEAHELQRERARRYQERQDSAILPAPGDEDKGRGS